MAGQQRGRRRELSDEERRELYGERVEHESYGTIAVSHISGGGAALFGSSIRHDEVIRIRICPASLTRNLNRDWIHGGIDPIVEVDLSYSQFTEFVTTHNRGTGVPCTIRSVQGRDMAEPPLVDKRAQHRAEFTQQTRRIAARLDGLVADLERILAEPSCPKSARRELLEAALAARQEISSNLPFAVRQFDEQMDLSVKEAKGEIEGFMLRRVLLAGQTALESEAVDPPTPALEAPASEEDDRGAQPAVSSGE